MSSYQVIEPASGRVPILLSVPHCGTAFPDELKNEFNPKLAFAPDDTDWFVHRLYNFAPAMGITLIHAVYSRWVIDLNRNPNDKPLYSDGRIITTLCPTTTFFGEPIYRDDRKVVEDKEIRRRIEAYYRPYHNKLQELLNNLKQEFGNVLLWDCHSIRQHVPTIHKEKFPDLILGDADGTSASPGLIETAIKNLEGNGYSVSHNYPFKGGYITRFFGKPADDQHALQLEMSKVNYMDDTEKHYDESRANRIKRILLKTLAALAEQLSR
ncbi:MAG: N-formylglutamate amidohydrolase [Flammeovirgaceae bacterium]|nr:MAG: N-formylglutamate amidohydrolase [Flammeovirgaceae bacterium]